MPDLGSDTETIAYLRRRADRCRAVALREPDVALAERQLRAADLFEREAARIAAGD